MHASASHARQSQATLVQQLLAGSMSELFASSHSLSSKRKQNYTGSENAAGDVGMKQDSDTLAAPQAITALVATDIANQTPPLALRTCTITVQVAAKLTPTPEMLNL